MGKASVRRVVPDFMHYNFVRIHKTLRVTPAMAAGVADRPWEIRDIVALLNRPTRQAELP
jgi:hypothetical protein